MNKIKAIIVDDEEGARNVLKNLLARTSPEVEVISLCQNVSEAVDAIKELQPDVVFLDVEMPDYAGYEVVQFFDKINFKIIFVTAYDKYAIKAFQLSAIDYLLKPINRLRLVEAIDKLKGQLASENIADDYQNLLESLEEKQFKKIVIPELNSKKVILLNDIIAIEAQRAYSTIYISNKKSLTVSKNLGYFESVLPENHHFFRTHRSWIVNLRKIESYSKSQGNINLEGGIVGKLSKHRLDEFEGLQ